MKNYCIGKINPTHPQFESFIKNKIKYQIGGKQDWNLIVKKVSYWLTGVVPSDPFHITSDKGRTIISCWPGNTRAIGAYLTGQKYPVIYQYHTSRKLERLVLDSRPLDESDWEKFPQLTDPHWGKPGFELEVDTTASHLFEETEHKLRLLWNNRLYFETI